MGSISRALITLEEEFFETRAENPAASTRPMEDR